MKSQFVFIFLLLLPIVGGDIVVEYGTDNLTWENITRVRATDGTAYQANLEEGVLYYFRARNDSSGWTYSTQRTLTSGEKSMSSLAVTGFVLLITLGIFALPSIFKRFSENIILDQTLKGLCYLMGLFLLSLDTAMVATISETFNLGLSNEIFRFLWLINWSIYITMLIVVLGFGYRILNTYNMKKQDQRYGYNEEG